jgi:hypothetical protein
VPTPSFALEVQRGSIPGAPNAIEFSGGFIGASHHTNQSQRCSNRRDEFERMHKEFTF